jgi:hypothetical protein
MEAAWIWPCLPAIKSLADLVVGDRFWLGYAQELGRAAVSAPDRRAEQLTNAIARFWSIYSAAALIVFTTRSPSLAILVPLALPVVLLIVAYWLASEVRAPIRIEFDPRVPSEIEAVHHQGALQKNRMLFWAEIVTGLAAACVVVAIVIALSTTSAAKPDFYIYAGLQDSNKLVLGGTFRNSRSCVCMFNLSVWLRLPQRMCPWCYRTSLEGELQAQPDVPQADAYRVTVGWNEEKVEKTITIEVKRGK